ncbi:MAG: hypothetical protein EOO43_10470 [Flavobacterium sp.]|nr:MAG: hypothetical protein EOO43_10470 [Flavobacterium sp.]
MAPIGDFLVRSREVEEIQDEKLYKRVTVRINNKGVVQRDEEFGKNIGTKRQFVARAGQFIVSKIDARNGAFGIIPTDLDGAIVTNDFPLFNVDNRKILTQFLLLITTTKHFVKFAQSCSSGTTNRQRMDIDLFLEQKIPLPSISEQRQILNEFQNFHHKVEDLSRRIELLNEEIENTILRELGIIKTELSTSKKGLQIFQFKNIFRWDVWANKTAVSKFNRLTSTFKDFVIGKPSYGANVKGVKIKSDTRYIRITDVNENGTLNDDFVSPEVVDSKYLLKEDDFLIARSGNTVGKTFLYKEKYGRAIYAGYLVKYKIDKSKVRPEYLLEYTKSYPFKQWIASAQRVAGQPNINGQEYLNAPVFVPDLKTQDKIVQKISDLRKHVNKATAEIETLKNTANAMFEKQIFNQ